jgi:hypothetical protein
MVALAGGATSDVPGEVSQTTWRMVEAAHAAGAEGTLPTLVRGDGPPWAGRHRLARRVRGGAARLIGVDALAPAVIVLVSISFWRRRSGVSYPAFSVLAAYGYEAQQQDAAGRRRTPVPYDLNDNDPFIVRPAFA